MRRAVRWMERNQAPLYLVALLGGGVAGLLLPGIGPALSGAVNPVLALVLYATFLGVPARRFPAAFRDVRFLAAVLVLDFVVAPVVVFVLSRVVAADAALLAGVLFVLLTPCVDYVIVFTGLAGGARDRLLAVTPLLMVLQILLLGPLLWLMAGPDLVAAVDPAPFLEAFVLIVVVPLVAAVLTQVAATRWRGARLLLAAATDAMVPLTMLALALVVGSQIHGVGAQLGRLAAVIPVFVAFVLVMTAAGWATGRIARVDVPGSRAVVFTGVTRNSLVVLPVVLTLPAVLDPAPLVVVTQTLVELVVLVALVRLVPKIIPGGGTRHP
ncbi:arsenic resistance protein [Microbacterium sp. X-17]|uniref:arsenic resistance protein n=1 Tax=Microbacterium sp. X-17 TaxID=3144404 RepID=UPI0031F57A7F